MREVVYSKSFRTAFKKFVHKNPETKTKIENTIRKMEEDIFAISLGVHKLTGELRGLRACSCGYDCRIVFFIDKSSESGNERIVLVDVGTHDEVY